MSTPTPAPWTFYNPDEQRPLTARGNPSDKRIMVLHPDGERLIACCNTGITNKDGSIPREERLANARLIAAAPDMLAALKGAQAALRKVLPFLPPDDEALFCGEWLDEINEAIAKATECPACNAPPNGPIPSYCPEHDGDYSAWLVSNNID